MKEPSNSGEAQKTGEAMDLYLIRHAEAMSLETAGVETDPERPLTSTGHEQCRSLARALTAQGVHLDVLVSSPLKRARETQEGLVQGGLSVEDVTLSDWLAPGLKP